MTMRWQLIALLAVVPAVLAGVVFAQDKKPEGKTRFFELRTYVASPGKMQALHARFRDHTNALFVKHGMDLVGYWQAASGENAENTLIYILAFPSKEAQKASWDAFKADPEWQKAKKESEADGIPLAAKVDSRFITPTDYSPIK
jgi:hypothetical protein